MWWLYWGIVAIGPISILLIEAGLRKERSIPRLIGWALLGLLLGLSFPFIFILLSPDSESFPLAALGAAGLIGVILLVSRSNILRKILAWVMLVLATPFLLFAVLSMTAWRNDLAGWGFLVMVLSLAMAAAAGFISYLLFRVPAATE